MKKIPKISHLKFHAKNHQSVSLLVRKSRYFYLESKRRFAVCSKSNIVNEPFWVLFKHCETGRKETKMRFSILDCKEHLVEEPNPIWHQWKCLMHIQAIPRLFFPPLDWEQISTSRKLSKIRWKLLTKLKKKKKFSATLYIFL